MLWIFIFAFSQAAFSQDLKGTLGALPVLAESNDKGILVDFVKEMQRVYTEGTLTFEVMPFKRSLQDAISGEVDFHAPILKDPDKTEEELGFAYSDANIWDVIFVLYTNRQKAPVSINNLAKLNIETDAGHVGFFKFNIHPSSCLECSLKKLDLGRIDGFIFAGMECDSLIRKDHLKNIKSAFYKKFEGKFVVPLGEKGRKTNAILTKIIEKTKRNGTFQKTFSPIVDYYKTWKPIP